MKSTEQILEIVQDYGLDDKPGLMRLCKNLRIQVAHETRTAIFKQYHLNQKIMNADFNLLTKHYENGT